MKAVETEKRNAEQTRRLLTTICLLVRTAPLTHLAHHLLDSGIFTYFLDALEDDKASGLILAAFLEILSRIAMIDANAFIAMVAESARRESKDGHMILEQVLDALWRNFDYVGEPIMRKAVAMGTGALLTTVSVFRNKADRLYQGNTQVLERLDGEFCEMFLGCFGPINLTMF
jgi:hypothetical protein